MIRRWGFISFFLLALLFAAGAWVGSYWRQAIGRHYSLRTGRIQDVLVGCGSLYVFTGEPVDSTDPWSFKIDPVGPWMTVIYGELYRFAPYRFLGFAFNADSEWFGTKANRMLIIPLWFPTVLSALGLLWAWRRKRRIDRTRRRGFEVQQQEPAA